MNEVEWDSVEKTVRLSDPYVTAGDRLYAIGSQDGEFLPTGGHIAGEMTGIWAHPHKVMDGFWVAIGWEDEAPRVPPAVSFCTTPAYTEHLAVQPGEWSLARRQWVPDQLPGLVVDLEYRNLRAIAGKLTLTVWFRSNLHPGWLSEASRGKDRAEVVSDPPSLRFENVENGWECQVATSESDAEWTVSNHDQGPSPRADADSSAFGRLTVTRVVEPGADCRWSFWIAASSEDWQSSEVHRRISGDRRELLRAKQERMRDLGAISNLAAPDKAVEHAYAWTKWQVDWLVREVPAIGRGLGAGFPEYPWWFGCDNAYALRGALSCGQFELSESTTKLLARASAKVNGNGRILHEISTTGVVYNPGNTQESAQFCQLVFEVFRWTGNRSWLHEMYPYAQAALHWVMEQAPDGDGLALGYGIIEIEDLNLKVIDTAVYTWAALHAMAELSAVMGEDTKAADYRVQATRLADEITRQFWLADQDLFGDMRALSSAMHGRIAKWSHDAAMNGRADVQHMLNSADVDTDGERTYDLRNWVINTPMEAGLADPKTAETALVRMRASDFRGTYGLYLSGLEQTKAMTISTGAQAVAEARYGHADQALDWMRRMALTMNWRMPGSMSEMSPDWGCFVQAWSVYGLAVPIVEYFFGLDPRADQRRVSIRCQMPEAWPWATLNRVRMGDNHLSLTYFREDTMATLTVYSERAWGVDVPEPFALVHLDPGARHDGGSHLDLAANTSCTIRWSVPSANSGQ